jgi:hypothetical protein
MQYSTACQKGIQFGWHAESVADSVTDQCFAQFHDATPRHCRVYMPAIRRLRKNSVLEAGTDIGLHLLHTSKYWYHYHRFGGELLLGK